MKLSELCVGQAAEVLSVQLPPALCERLRMLNVRPGARVRALRRAPFGGGLLLDAAGVRLALRDSLAAVASDSREFGIMYKPMAQGNAQGCCFGARLRELARISHLPLGQLL